MDVAGLQRESLIRSADRDTLVAYVEANLRSLTEQEALDVLGNRFCVGRICQQIAQDPRLTSFYSVRERLVAHRQTPLGHALRLVHYLFWPDLLHLSTDVLVPPPVRRAIDNQLVNKLVKMTLGEKVTMARSCSREVLNALLFDPNEKVFHSLLNNPRMTEDDLVMLIASQRATAEQLRLIGNDRKWSFRYGVRKALVLNPATPRAVAATQLRFLKQRDLDELLANPQTSIFLRRCIERMRGNESETFPN
jgi:hypothetical protein